jgi:hypothetical protein
VPLLSSSTPLILLGLLILMPVAEYTRTVTTVLPVPFALIAESVEEMIELLVSFV